MIDGMFQAGTDSALDDQVQRPAPFKPEEPKFSFGQVAKAPFQGVASGATKSAGFAAEIAGAFGDVMGAGGFNAGGMFAAPTPDERKQQGEASRRLLEMGPQYSNPAGDLFRARAKEIMPDPTQTHAAAQIIAGVSEFATQAVGYAALGGPVGPALLAGDAALAESDKLKQEGVPLGARSAAGAVAGAVAGVSVALPVVGKTVAKTAGLVAAGGPGGFIAQNAAERAILENAGYDKLASQYDPLDPVGLALSSVVPAVFGGVALRARAKAPVSLKDVVLGIESNGQRFGKDGKVLTSPKGAKGEMQVMDGTNLDPGFGVRPAVDDSLAERARVGSDYLDAMLKRYGTEDKAMAAYNAGPGAVDKALARGGDWLKSLPAETQAYVTKGMKKLEGGRTTEAARAVIARDPEAVAAARVSQTAQVVDSFRLTPDSDLAGMTRHVDAMESAHDMLARGEKVEVADLVRTMEGERPAGLARSLGEVYARDSRPTIQNKAGELFFETRGGVERFHGTSREISSLSNDYALAGDSRNIYGQGFYTTDAADISAGYMRKGKGKGKGTGDGVLYRVETSDAKLFDMEASVTPELEAILRDNMGDSLPIEHGETGKPLANLREIYDEYRAESKNNGMSRDDVQEVFDGIRYRLEEQGYRGFSHTGGNNTGNADHAVKIFWQPEADVQITKADLSDYQPRPAEIPRMEEAPSWLEPDPNTSGTPEAKQSAALESQSAEIAAIDPGMMVQLEGREPMKVSELLEQVKAEAKEDAQEASFVEAAVNCLLRNE